MTTPHYEDQTIRLFSGDCLDILADLPDNSVDAVVTDPPYDLTNRTPDVLGCESCGRTLGGRDGTPDACPRCGGELTRQRSKQGKGFMGKAWDGTGVAFDPETWRRVHRVLKPGGHLLAFGGTRTWHRLACAIEDAGFEVRDSIAWLYGSGFPKSLDVSKAIDKAAGAEREVTRIGTRHGSAEFDPAASTDRERRDAPATPDAARWQGWGTALKPAFEPVVVARKPLGGAINVRARVEYELRQRGVEEVRWTPASVATAERPSPSRSSAARKRTPASPADASETGSSANATANGSGPRTQPGAPPTPTALPQTASGPETGSAPPSSTHMAASVPAAVKPQTPSSPSTTSTAAGTSTARQSAATSTPNSEEKGSPTATESFVGIATGLSGSLAHVHIRTTETGELIWPAELPEVVSVGSTVAATVLAHGTGALNIDGCRIGLASESDRASAQALAELRAKGRRIGVIGEPGQGDSLAAAVSGDSRTGEEPVTTHTAGRWPANVVLDESQADALDQARFFYVAKAGKKERPRVDGVAHPTVKPLALMRWLVRLVTPPGGVVLEPFAGSGTTIQAATLEGFRCIAIEREPDYLPLILNRLGHPQFAPAEPPTVDELATSAAADDGGDYLFDLDGEAS